MPLPPTGGTTLTAAILLTVATAGILLNIFRQVAILLPHLAIIGVLLNLVYLLVELAVLATMVMLWMKQPIIRLIGIISLGVYIAFDLLGFVFNISWGPILLLVTPLSIVALVMLCLPGTARYLESRRTGPAAAPGYPVPPPGYPPR